MLGKPKMDFSPPAKDEALAQRIETTAAERMHRCVTIADKMERQDAVRSLKAEIVEELGEEYLDRKKEIGEIFKDLKKRVSRDLVLKENRRIDGRRFDEIRPITCEVGLLPRPHGSALFTRGETQVLGVLTLGSGPDEQRVGRRGFVRWALTPDEVVELLNFPGCSDGFEAIAPHLRAITRERDIGMVTVRLIPLAEMLTVAEKVVRDDPHALLCQRATCERCRSREL